MINQKLHDELLVRPMAGELVGSTALRSLLASQRTLGQEGRTSIAGSRANSSPMRT